MAFAGGLSHYELLGVSRNATMDEIKSAWRKMSLSLHPDKNAYGANLMKAINEAYEILSDEDERRRYDREGGAGTSDSRRSSSSGNDAEARRLKRQLREAKNRIDTLQNQLDSKISTIGRLQTQLDGNMQELVKAKQESRSHASKLRNTEKDLMAAKLKVKTVEHELKNQVSYYELEIKGLQYSLNEAQSDCGKLQGKVAHFESENAGLMLSLDKAQTENNDLYSRINDQADSYEKQKEDAERALEEEKERSRDAVKWEREWAKGEIEKMKTCITFKQITTNLHLIALLAFVIMYLIKYESLKALVVLSFVLAWSIPPTGITVKFDDLPEANKAKKAKVSCEKSKEKKSSEKTTTKKKALKRLAA